MNLDFLNIYLKKENNYLLNDKVPFNTYKEYYNNLSVNDKNCYAQSHPFHLVDESPWPILVGFITFFLFINLARYFNGSFNGSFFVIFNLISLIIAMGFWGWDVVVEATYLGHHTLIVQKGLWHGMIYFILSEILFFFSFFWAYFHSSLSPTTQIGGIWPPLNIIFLNPWGLPFLNTILLICSGITVTWSILAIRENNKIKAVFSLAFTLILGITFTLFQLDEYINASLQINDGICGSLFYLLTGFHGLHVIIGTILLSICFYRLIINNFSQTHHFGFEAASWYWHFVDVVWIFLFIFVYWWGN